jgi:hypothetical protein
VWGGICSTLTMERALSCSARPWPRTAPLRAVIAAVLMTAALKREVLEGALAVDVMRSARETGAPPGWASCLGAWLALRDMGLREGGRGNADEDCLKEILDMVAAVEEEEEEEEEQQQQQEEEEEEEEEQGGGAGGGAATTSSTHTAQRNRLLNRGNPACERRPCYQKGAIKNCFQNVAFTRFARRRKPKKFFEK